MTVETTGSITAGAVPGMAVGCIPSGTKALGVRLIYTQFSPDGYITCVTGSDLAYCVGDGKFYMGDVTNGAGGSSWAEIK
jgi:hypothetical protein